MTKKIFYLCMFFAMTTALTLVTSCSKDETTEIIGGTIPVEINIENFNYENVQVTDKTEAKIALAFTDARDKAQKENTTPKDMASKIVSYTKANLKSTLTEEEIGYLKNSELYYAVKVYNKDTKELLSEAKLICSEL